MTQNDAAFQDGGDAPLRLQALDTQDVLVISSLIQDSVFPVTEITWQASKRRFAILLNRFRWEDAPHAQKRKRSFERVQAVLAVHDVLHVRSKGVVRDDKAIVLSLLSLDWQPGQDGTGVLHLILAGGGVISLRIETLDVILQDMTRPYVAPSGHAPTHNL